MRRDHWVRTGVALLAGVALLFAVGRWWRLTSQEGGGDSRMDNRLIVGEPLTHGNMSIFLVSSAVPKNQDRFITLDEGLAAGTVEVAQVGSIDTSPVEQSPFPDPCASKREQPMQPPPSSEDPFENGPDVNRLLVTNRSQRPLYLMSGEIFVGGQQDRTLAEELIVPPRTRRMPIEVFCVEQGRWASRDLSQVALMTGGLTAPNGAAALNVNELAERASAGRFPQSGAALNKSARLTVQVGQGQQQVWEAVARVNSRSGADTDSDAFTANYVQPDVVEKLQPYLDALDKQVAASERVVGAIVAINGKVEIVDVFESTPLFRKLWPKLLKSYALDAAAAEETAGEMPATVADAEEFLDRVAEAQGAATANGKGQVTTRGDFDDVATFSLHDQRSANSSQRSSGAMGGMGGGMMGGFGGGVHSAGFGK